MTTIDIASSILRDAKSSDYAGYDPFDALNSAIFKATPFNRSRICRLSFLQFLKRSPINFRPLLLVPKRRNPKGVALFISGLLQDYSRTGDNGLIEEALRLADWLITQRSDRNEWLHSCWGYHFDWQARAFYVPKGKPNIITTCYVANALFELSEISNRDDLKEIALDSAYFITKKLHTTVNGYSFFAYIPGEDAFVHNASLWGAAWCAKAGVLLGDNKLQEQARQVAHQSVREQSSDGSWRYGTLHHHDFIDGFHTGYNLEALHVIAKSLSTTEFDACIEKGYKYYTKNLFTLDGSAKYYSTSIYPLDMHNAAQAILTILKLRRDEESLQLCQQVVSQAIKTLYIPEKGRFTYQKTRWLTNRINYTRWTQAWAYYSLAFYNRYRTELDNAKN